MEIRIITKAIMFILSINLIISTCFAQSSGNFKLTDQELKGDTLNKMYKILYIINNLKGPPKITENLIINTLDIDSIRDIPMVNPKKLVKRCGFQVFGLSGQKQALYFTD